MIGVYSFFPKNIFLIPIFRYSISVGELGVDTAALEKSLHNILELASVWKAVVLLDEGFFVFIIFLF
jgi:hypothetical protein